MKAVLALAVLALHQDFWFWKDATLVLGFVPVGLAYHLAYCVLAALTLWALARRAPPEEEGPPGS